MRTCIVTTTFLEPQERLEKTKKFLDYYGEKTAYDIIVLDNASPIEKVQELVNSTETQFSVIGFKEHFSRSSIMDYKYLWRAVHYLQVPLKAYDKIVYMDNDFYMLSPKMFEFVDSISTGWHTFWCPKYNFPETGCHILTKDDQPYKDFVNMSQEEFINKHNMSLMETVLPVSSVNKQFVGDRYGEFEQPPENFTGLDFWAQALNKTEFLK